MRSGDTGPHFTGFGRVERGYPVVRGAMKWLNEEKGGKRPALLEILLDNCFRRGCNDGLEKYMLVPRRCTSGSNEGDL
jgi:hypothetical protein